MPSERVTSRGGLVDEHGLGFERQPRDFNLQLLEPMPGAEEHGLPEGIGGRMPTTPERVSSRRDRDRENSMEDMLPPPEPPRAAQPFLEAPPAAPPPFPPDAPPPAACASPNACDESHIFNQSQLSGLDVTRDPMAVSRLGSQISQPGNVTQEISLLGSQSRIPGLNEPNLLFPSVQPLTVPQTTAQAAPPELRAVSVPPMSPFLQTGRNPSPLITGSNQGPSTALRMPATAMPSYHTRTPVNYATSQPVTIINSPPSSVQIRPGGLAPVMQYARR